MRALIVDDNATNRQILQRQLGAAGVISQAVGTGAQALVALREHAAGLRYDVAIVDLEMPGMDGLMLAQLIKTDPVLASTRLLMMSSRGGRADLGAQGVHIDGWLTKPVKQIQLLRALAGVCGTEVAGPAPTQFTFQCGTAKLSAEVPATGNFDTFQKVELGRITVRETGELTVAIRPNTDGWHAINLRQVILQRVP